LIPCAPPPPPPPPPSPPSATQPRALRRSSTAFHTTLNIMPWMAFVASRVPSPRPNSPVAQGHAQGLGFRVRV